MSTLTEHNRGTKTEQSCPDQDLFDRVLNIGVLPLNKVLELLEFAIRSLLELIRTFSRIFFVITAVYAILIWRHYPAEEPRMYIIYWCASLVAVNLGERALDGKNAPPMTYHLALMVVAYLFPVQAFSELLQAF